MDNLGVALKDLFFVIKRQNEEKKKEKESIKK